MCILYVSIYVDIQIGFQNSSYILIEPQFETDIIVFLEKQDGQRTEQTYGVVIIVTDATPSANIQAATLSTSISDEDYIVTAPDERSFVFLLQPEHQFLDFLFTLFSDDLVEGTEGFRVFSYATEDPTSPIFTAPSSGVLFPSTFIIIADDDCKLHKIALYIPCIYISYIYLKVTY